MKSLTLHNKGSHNGVSLQKQHFTNGSPLNLVDVNVPCTPSWSSRVSQEALKRRCTQFCFVVRDAQYGEKATTLLFRASGPKKAVIVLTVCDGTWHCLQCPRQSGIY